MKSGFYTITAVLLFIFTGIQTKTYSQSDPTLQVVSPPPPDVSALGKFGQVPINNFTGVPDISVPIYTINEGTLTLPISVRYHAGGIKVKEDASEVGLGWALSAGGSITAIVRGTPDFEGGFAGTYSYMPDEPNSILSTREPAASINDWYYAWKNDLKNIDSYDEQGYYRTIVSGLELPTDGGTQQYYNYFTYIGHNAHAPDFASDLYILNIGNKSYKFIFDNDLKPVILGDGSLRIECIGDGTIPNWKVTDEKGATYYFTQRQKSYSNTVDPTPFETPSQRTWHLTKITSATYGEINFNYLHSIDTFLRPLPNVSQTYRVGNSSPNIQKELISIVPYYTMYEQCNIDSIRFSLGYVKFLYNDQRLDLRGARRLVSIEVRNKSDKMIKKVNFDNAHYFTSSQSGYFGSNGYHDFSGYTTDHHLKRLKLNGINEINLAEDRIERKHKFTYNESVNIPGKLSLSIDHWGLYNGAKNSELVPPAKVTLPTQINPIEFAGADREANPAYSQANVLTSVQYPTGAISKFAYENNQYTRNETVVTYHDETSSFFKDAESTTLNSSGFVDSNGDFIAKDEWHGKKLRLFCLVNWDANQYPPSQYELNIVVKENGNFLKRIGTLNGTHIQDSSIVIKGGSSYNISFEQTTSAFFNSCEIRRQVEIVKASSTSEEVLKTYYFGGLRVDNIETYDPLTSKTNIREYTYLDGSADDIPIYVSPVGHDHYLVRHGDGNASDEEVTHDNPFRYRFGQSIYNFSDGRDAPYFGYGVVQISDLDGDGNPNGMIEYIYNNLGSVNINTMLHYSNQSGFQIVNPILPQIPSVTRGRGDLLYEKHFKIVYDYMKLVAMDHYSYTQENSTKIWQMLFNHGFAQLPINGRVFEIHAHHFAVAVNRNRLERKMHYEYDEEEKETLSYSESYQYDNVNGHFQLITKTTTTSSGDTYNVYFKYPQDYVGIQDQTNLDDFAKGILNLQNKHIITPVESYKEITPKDSPGNKNYVNGVLNTFKNPLPSLDQVMIVESDRPLDYLNFSTVVDGKFVKDAHYNSRVKFTYDGEGRILEQADIGNYPVSYLWGYNKTYPIAKVINAALGEIAYSSFEKGATEGWDTSEISLLTNASIAKTGSAYALVEQNKKMYSPSLPPGEYWIEFYARPMVAGGSSALLVDGSTVNLSEGYKMYSLKINLSSGRSIEISGLSSGAAIVDELRIYPTDAQMTTFTHDPLIGTASQTDPSGQVTHYEYDGFGRLKTVSDSEGNILKKHDYHYID